MYAYYYHVFMNASSRNAIICHTLNNIMGNCNKNHACTCGPFYEMPEIVDFSKTHFVPIPNFGG